jgi:hypothetical protein
MTSPLKKPSALLLLAPLIFSSSCIDRQDRSNQGVPLEPQFVSPQR